MHVKLVPEKERRVSGAFWTTSVTVLSQFPEEDHSKVDRQQLRKPACRLM